MAIVYFDRTGNVARREPTITDEQAKQVLDGLLGVR